MSMAPTRRKPAWQFGGGMTPSRPQPIAPPPVSTFVAPKVVGGKLTSQEDLNYVMASMRGPGYDPNAFQLGGMAGGVTTYDPTQQAAMQFVGSQLPELNQSMKKSTGDRLKSALPALAMLAGPIAGIYGAAATGIGAGAGAGAPALSNVAGAGLPTSLSSGLAAAPGAYGATAGGAQMFGAAGGTAAAQAATTGGTSLSNMAPANIATMAPVTQAAGTTGTIGEIFTGPTNYTPPVSAGAVPSISPATQQLPPVSTELPAQTNSFESLVPDPGSLDLSSFPAADVPFTSGMGYGAGGGLDPLATGAGGIIPPWQGGTSVPGLTLPTDPSILGSFGSAAANPQQAIIDKITQKQPEQAPAQVPEMPTFEPTPQPPAAPTAPPVTTPPSLIGQPPTPPAPPTPTAPIASAAAGGTIGSVLDKVGELGAKYGPVVFAGIEYKNARDASDAYEQQLNTIIEQSDPFGPERAHYQRLLQQHLDDPEAFLNSPQIKFAADAAARKFASMGYNMSPAQGQAIADASIGQYWNQANLLAGLSGGNFSPDTSAVDAAFSRTVGAGYNQAATGSNVAREIIDFINARNETSEQPTNPRKPGEPVTINWA